MRKLWDWAYREAPGWVVLAAVVGLLVVGMILVAWATVRHPLGGFAVIGVASALSVFAAYFLRDRGRDCNCEQGRKPCKCGRAR
jgi:hypothetical protein